MIKGQEFTLDIVSPDQLNITKQIVYAQCPGENGVFGVLKGHQPMVVGLQPGVLKMKDPEESLFIGGGFANIKEDKCTILTDQFIHLNDIDADDVLSFIQDTEKRMEKELEIEERESLNQSLFIEKAKLEIIKKLKT